MYDLEPDWDRPARSGAQPTTHILRVRLRPAEAVSSSSGLPLRLAIALDTSNSMTGSKLAHARTACEAVIAQLRTEDRLWLCGYSGEVMPMLSALPGGPAASAAAHAALEKLQASSVTRMDLALEWIQNVLPADAGVVSMGILITDGHATDFGGRLLDDSQPLLRQAEALSAQGIALSTVGLGDAANFNTGFLVTLADRARGGFLYADTPEALETELRMRLTTGQTMAVEEARLVVKREQGVRILQCCRIRPDFLPLDAPSDEDETYITVGGLRADIPTDLLLLVEVASLPTALSGNRPVLQLHLEAPGQPVSQSIALSILETTSYTISQQVNADVDNDRLYWDLNTYSSALANSDNARRTAQLLSRIEHTASRAGQEQIASQAMQQLEDLNKTGTLNAHRATGLLRSTRKLGEAP